MVLGDPGIASPSADVINPVEMPDFGGSDQPGPQVSRRLA